MITDQFLRQFDRIGARAVPSYLPDRRSTAVRLDIKHDPKIGEYFDIAVGRQADLRVVDARQDLQHLLLLCTPVGATARDTRLRFLCGHDERHWFVAGVPERPNLGSVRAAMEALKPEAVRLEQDRRHVPARERLARRNAAYVRQGEWFFVPRPGRQFPESQIRCNEPLSRGWSGADRAHWVEELCRIDGELVYVCNEFPDGLTPDQHTELVRRDPVAALHQWRHMHRRARVFARRRVSHKDHDTIYLSGWHEVFLNTESEAPGAQFVEFLD